RRAAAGTPGRLLRRGSVPRRRHRPAARRRARVPRAPRGAQPDLSERGRAHGEGRARGAARLRSHRCDARSQHKRDPDPRRGRRPVRRADPRPRHGAPSAAQGREGGGAGLSGIQIQGVTKVYPNGVKAIDNLDLEVTDGEFVVLVGPSGCGKSTLLRMVAGLEDVTYGSIVIGGADVTEMAPQQRDIAMVFQNYALYPHMSVRDNLAYGLKIRKLRKREWQGRGNPGPQSAARRGG